MYQSPEILEEKSYNEKVDIYSLGLILFELCYLFKTYSERRITLEDMRKNNHIPQKIQEKYPYESILISKMTNPDPKCRPSTEEIIHSAEYENFLYEFDFSNDYYN